MSEKVKQLITKNQFENEQKLFADILEVLDQYQGKISIVSAIGVLNLAQDELKMQAKNDD